MNQNQTPETGAEVNQSEAKVHCSAWLERTDSICDEDEKLIQQCIETIVAEENASVSLLQRRYRLGYLRAARIMDELERRNIVGPATKESGTWAREIIKPVRSNE